MSDLFDQFITESQDLLEEAGAALLALERDPADREAVDGLFRAFHTLKGASALFDLVPFTRLVHAGEDTLSLLRDGRRSMTPDLADRLFRALDQCARWVAALEGTGSLPPDAAAAADRLLPDLLAGDGDGEGGAPAAAPPPTAPGFDWVAALGAEDRRAAGLADGAVLTVIDYAPDPECFFTGDDPLALFRRVPDLRLLRIEPAEPLPPLPQVDPYRCVLRFRALSGAAADAVAPAFRSVPDQVRIGAVTLAPPAPGSGASSRPAAPASLAEAMLAEQVRVLELPGNAAEREARRAAVVRAVAAILTALGRPADRVALEAAGADAAALRGFLAGQSPAVPAPDQAAPVAAPVARRALRVEPERMDALMALVGELSVAKGELAPLLRRAAAGDLGRDLKAFSDRLDGLVGDLRHAALRLRLLPLSRVFDPLPRLVRDTARRLGKTVDLVMEGGETEADKDILDVLGEPLLHLVRNALDHGIEAPDRRAAAGKPTAGTLRVRAFQDKGGVVVEVTDDGAGIDPAAMRRAAAAKGLVTPEAAAELSDADAVRLVFAPGFSTAAGVSDLSGRGVGMDAVRAAVERAGGRVEIASTSGTGTTVRLLLPLTLSITRVLVVEAAGSLYGVPVAIVDSVRRVPRGAVRAVKRAESVVLRDRVVPLVRLRRLLGLPEDEAARDADCVLLAEPGDGPVAVAVDDVGDRADVVLRPLTGVLRGLRGYTGTAVLGDGRLILVLDLRELL